MNKLLIIGLLGCILVSCETNTSHHKVEKNDNKITIGQKDQIHSEILNEDREIWIHLPDGATTDSFSETKYPVLYLLDGDAHFYSVTGMIKQLSTVNGNTITPQMIVVGITNTDRTRDLTPTHVKEMNGDSTFTKTSGGGNRFLDFLENELIPYIENTYPATNYRTFVGHSFGGLAVIHTLVERPELFNNYVAIDPSLWWDDQELLKRATQVMSEKKYNKKSLFVGVANTMEEGMVVTEVEKDTSETTEHIRSILEFVKTTETQENALQFKWKYYDDDDHGSVPLITEYDAFRFLFPWYTFDEINQFFDPNSKATPEDLLNLISAHYQNVSNEFGYETLAPESFINSLGYGFLNNKKLNYAKALFSLNIKNYPNSSNAHDSMGDCLLAMQDSIKALEYFTKALEVGENNFSQEKIDMLNEKLKLE